MTLENRDQSSGVWKTEEGDKMMGSGGETHWLTKPGSFEMILVPPRIVENLTVEPYSVRKLSFP